jgi:hypothetical protein
MPSLQPLLIQFRTRYPIGSLISEFLTVYDGRFVVRASVQMGGATVATGLAIAPDLEQAEDRAKVRALEALGLGTVPATVPAVEVELPGAATLPSPSVDAGLSYSPSPISDPTTLPPYLPLPAIDPPDPVPPSIPSSSSLLPLEPAPARIVADLYTHLAESDDGGNGADLAEEPVDLSKIVTPASQLLGKTPRRKANVDASPIPEPAAESATESGSDLEPERAPEPAPASPASPASASIDFSDVLMETDVELRRLGWDSKKGREHLKRTYSKRSRQELSETELYDFLEYLKTQPSLGQTPF